MDAHKELAVKKAEDVVLVIPMESTAAENSSNQPGNGTTLESLQGAQKVKPKTPSPESSKAAGISPKKGPRPPQPEALIRRSLITKPKSRFEEPVNSSDRSRAYHDNGSPNQKASGTPKIPRSNIDEEEEEEEEEDEVYKEELLQKTEKRRKKWKIWLLIEWVMLILATACLISSLMVQRLQGYVIWGLQIWKWCLMLMVIFCGQLVTQWFMTALVFLIEINYLFRKKVLYFVYGLQKSVRVCVWLGLVLLSWSLIFNDSDVPRSPKTAKALNYVTRVLGSLLVGSVIWLVKTLLVKILASSFHMNRFFDRIQETLYHQYLLKALSGPSLMEMAVKVGPSKSPSQFTFRNIVKIKGKGIGEKLDVIDIANFNRISQEKISHWTLRGHVNVIRSSGLSTISNKIDESFDENKSAQKGKEITNEGEARAAAQQIFKGVAKPGYKYIEVEDLMRFLSKEEITFMLPLFEGASETGKIKKSALSNWVMIVEEMNILSTVFLQSDNAKIYYPNSVLATKPILNFYRSPDMRDTVEFSVDISTSLKRIADMKARIKTYIYSNPVHWHQHHSIVVKDIENVNKMNIILYVTHTMNYQNIGERDSRRTDLVLELKKIFDELSIQHNLLPQEVHLSYIGPNPLPMSVCHGQA